MTTVSGQLVNSVDGPRIAATVVLRRIGGMVGFDGGAIVPDTLTFVTDGSGLLTMADLLPGVYELSVSVPINPETSVTVRERVTGRVPADAPVSMALDAFLDTNVEQITPSLVAQAMAAAGRAEDAAASAATSAQDAQTWTPEYAADVLDDLDAAVAQTGLDALAASAARTGAETARDSSFANAKGAATIDDARALVADTETFIVYAAGAQTFDAYRRLTSTTQEFLGRYPTAAVAGVLPQQERVFGFPRRDGFDTGGVVGALGPDMETVSAVTWSLVGGEIVATNELSAGAKLFFTGFEYFAGKPLRACAVLKFANVDGFRRMIIAIGTPGDSNTLQMFAATNAGTVTQENTASNTSVKTLSFSTNGAQYGADEFVTLDLVLGANGNGYLRAESAAGFSVLPLFDITPGKVFVGTRTASPHAGFTIKQFTAEIEDVQAEIANPAPVAFSDRSPNILNSDFLTPVTFSASGDFINKWSAQHSDAVSNVTRRGRNAVRLFRAGSSTNVRIEKLVPIGATNFTYHVFLDDLLDTTAFEAQCAIEIIHKADGSTLRTDLVYLQKYRVGSVSGVVDIEAGATSILFRIVTAAGVALVVSSVSVAFSDQPGFRALPVTVAEVQQELALQGYSLVPDEDPARVNEGFTITGLDRVTRGAFAGCWIVGSDGRLVEGDDSPYNPNVYIVSPDWRVILAQFTMPYTGAGVQGVTIDTSGSADTFWVACAGNKTIRHFHLYGDDAGDEITADRFDWDAAEFDSQPNAVAYDADADAIYVSPFIGQTVRLISCDPSASPRVIDTITLSTPGTGSSNSADQFYYDRPRKNLFYTVGGNGSNGLVRVINVDTEIDFVAYGDLPLAQAIEGVYIDRALGVMTLTNDGGYHTAASPALNIAIQYLVPLIG